eukprot:GFUD01045469.1.p1 GENE.GFUD01045469.1~~GFUD01045469.1.p1  ORF type:complete len:347 (-),score=138.07 GFUD01045469.1:130-1170(-)
MSVAGTGKFMSKKVSKVRWMPMSDTSQPISTSLATGSWDDEMNSVVVWGGAGLGGEARKVGSADHPGDVTGLVWLSQELLAATSSTGCLVLYRVTASPALGVAQEWPQLHKAGGGGCTALACYGDSLATGGQDGKINVLVSTQRSPVKVYEKGDSCSITSLAYTRTSELVSSNMRGQLKTWDLRSNSQTPVTTSSQGAGVTCLARHPTQSHILVAGGGDGVLAVWDLRSPSHPTTLLSAHKAALSEVQFHPTQPDHLFTCSQGGDICHWNGASIRRGGGPLDSFNQMDNLNTTSPWLSSEAVKHKVETHSLVAKQPLPVNSLDVVGHSVVFGGDNEAFYVLHNVIF